MIPTCRYLKKYCYLCTILNTCIDECPSGAISEGEKYSIDPDACTECGTCADVCPNEAISLP